MNRYDYEYSPSHGVYFILDRTRGTDVYQPYRKALAKTSSVSDAEKIVDALNAAEAPV
jgi:hypothetical protein